MPEGYNYVALVPINYDGVHAFNPGDPVPDSHVKDHELTSDQVAKKDSAKAKQAMGLSTGGDEAKA